MIPARNSRFYEFTAGRLIQRAVRRYFHAFYLDGLEHLAALDPARPVVGCCNHTNWWDGFVLYSFSRQRMRDRAFQLAMDEKNLRRYFFFPGLGVFGVDLESKTGAVAGMRYGARLLQERADRVLWVFVQGVLTSPRMPIVARPGASFFARQSNAQILPVIIRYEWLIESRASVVLTFGPALGPAATPEEIASALNSLAAKVDARIEARGVEGLTGFHPARISLNKRWDYLLHRLRGGSREDFNAQNQ